MAKRVIVAPLDRPIGAVRELFLRKRIHAVPIVGPRKELRGIVTSADLARRWKDETPVARAMNADVVTVSATTPANEAARLMRRHRIHHVVVVDKDKAVGIVSSFDLLKLVEQDTGRPGDDDGSADRVLI